MLKSNDEYKNVILKNIDIANKNSPNRPVKINGKGYCEVPEGVTKIDNGCFYNRIKLKKLNYLRLLKKQVIMLLNFLKYLKFKFQKEFLELVQVAFVNAID